MLSHVYIGVGNFDRAFIFYSTTLPQLGWRQKFVEADRAWAGWQPLHEDRPLIVVGKPFDGRPASAGNGQMVALTAPSRQAVDDFYAVAIALGATDEGGPGLRPEYHEDYYGAYVRDPDGNKLCVCCHHPE
jgi:catechol 2,3-dioxygenase-like lactoylglutathione lyase family enzyme